MNISENLNNLCLSIDNSVKLVAVSKTKSNEQIMDAYEAGQKIFGENKVLEAEHKWFGVKKKFSNLKLHMIGKLQSNKAKKAVKIFDYIHSLDNA